MGIFVTDVKFLILKAVALWVQQLLAFLFWQQQEKLCLPVRDGIRFASWTLLVADADTGRGGE